MEQAVAQLQQEVFSLNAQVAAESGLADAVQAIKNLASAESQKDTPSLIDVKGLGRPKEFSCKEEDFQQWSQKNGGLLRGCDQGVCDDARVGRRAGNRDYA